MDQLPNLVLKQAKSTIDLISSSEIRQNRLLSSRIALNHTRQYDRERNVLYVYILGEMRKVDSYPCVKTYHRFGVIHHDAIQMVSCLNMEFNNSIQSHVLSKFNLSSWDSVYPAVGLALAWRLNFKNFSRITLCDVNFKIKYSIQ